MFSQSGFDKTKILDSFPKGTLSINLKNFSNLESIRNIPDTVCSIQIENAPKLKSILLPPCLGTLILKETPNLKINWLPQESLTLFCWYDCDPTEMPELPSSIHKGEFIFDTKDGKQGWFRVGLFTESKLHDANLYFVKERAKKRMEVIGQELRIKALSPERVAKWIGEEDNPNWELLDSIFGID